MKKRLPILIKFGTVLIWFFCFIAALNLSLIENEFKWFDKYGCIGYVIFSIIFVILKMKYLKHCSNPHMKFQLVNAVMPLLYVPFAICWFHVDFGYGNTLGILGYNREVGILSEMHVSYLLGCWLLIFVFTAIWSIIIVRTKLAWGVLCYHGKTIKSLSTISMMVLILFGILLISKSIDDLIDNAKLSDFALSWYMMSSALYWGTCCSICFVNKIIKWIKDDS